MGNGHSLVAKPFVLDWTVVLVVQLVVYNALIYILTGVRWCLHQLMVIQRLPMLVLLVTFMVGVRSFSSSRGVHRFFLMGVRRLLRWSFFLRGIRVTIDAPHRGGLAQYQGVNVCNNFNMAPWVLMSVLPYDHLLIAVDPFFKSSWFRPLLFLLGFYPQEHGITPENLSQFESRLTPYFDQSFSIWQPIFFEYRDLSPLPYAVIMAIKHGYSINVWKCHESQGLEFVHWLRRRTLRLELVNQVAMSRRYALTISAYHQTIAQHFGAPTTQALASLESAPGMPKKSSDLAREKIAAGKKLSDQLESGDLPPSV